MKWLLVGLIVFSLGIAALPNGEPQPIRIGLYQGLDDGLAKTTVCIDLYGRANIFMGALSKTNKFPFEKLTFPVCLETEETKEKLTKILESVDTVVISPALRLW